MKTHFVPSELMHILACNDIANALLHQHGYDSADALLVNTAALCPSIMTAECRREPVADDTSHHVAVQNVESVRGGIGSIMDGSALRWGLGSMVGVAGGIARTASGTSRPPLPQSPTSPLPTQAFSSSGASSSPAPGVATHLIQATDAASPALRAPAACAGSEREAPANSAMQHEVQAVQSASEGQSAEAPRAQRPDPAPPVAQHVHVRMHVQQQSGGAESVHVNLQVSAPAISDPSTAAAAGGIASRLPLSNVLGGLFTRRPAQEVGAQVASPSQLTHSRDIQRADSIQAQASRALAAAQAARLEESVPKQPAATDAVKPQVLNQPVAETACGTTATAANTSADGTADTSLAAADFPLVAPVQEPVLASPGAIPSGGTSWFSRFGRGNSAEVDVAGSPLQQQPGLQASQHAGTSAAPASDESSTAVGAAGNTTPSSADPVQQPSISEGAAPESRMTAEERRALRVGLELAHRLRDVIANVLQAYHYSTLFGDSLSV